MTRRRSVIVALLAVFLLPSAYTAWIARDMPHLGSWHDDAIYFVSAKSLAQGNGYRIASLPDSPWQTKYPPLFPLYLSLVWRIVPEFPANLPWVTLACWLLVPLWLALSWRLLRDLGIGSTHALILCGVLAVNQHAMVFGTLAMSEIMFSVLCMASLILAMRTGSSLRLAALAGLAGGAAYLTKSAALPLIGAVPLYLALRKHRSSAAVYALAMLPAVAVWTIWMRAHLSPSTDVVSLYYTNYFGYQTYNLPLADLPAAFARNLERLFWAVGSLVAGMGEGAVDEALDWVLIVNFVGRALTLITLAGVIRHARLTGLNPCHLFAGAYILMMLVWHYPPSERFLFPLLPLLLAGLSLQIQSLGELLKRLGRPFFFGSRAAAVGLACIWCLLIGNRLFVGVPTLLDVYRRMHDSNVEAYQWIAANTPSDARVLSYEDPVLYLYSGRTGSRRTIPTKYFYRGDADGVKDIVHTLPEFARQHRLQYLMAGPNDWHGDLLPNSVVFDFRRQITELPEVTPVYRSALTTIYRFESDGHASVPSKVE